MMTRRKSWLILPLLLTALFLGGCDTDDDDFFPILESEMNWILHDRCNDGRGLQAALFETETGRTYPSRDSVYVSDPGQSIDVVITCRDDFQVCYGAEPDPASGIFWGVGLEGNAGCDDCCDRCRDNVVEFDLFCDGDALRATPLGSSTVGEATPEEIGPRVRGEARRVRPKGEEASDD